LKTLLPPPLPMRLSMRAHHPLFRSSFPTCFIQLIKSHRSRISSGLVQPSIRIGTPGMANNPSLNMESNLLSSRTMSKTYPFSPSMRRWVAEKITTTDPAGISFPFVMSSQHCRSSDNDPSSILTILMRSPVEQGRVGGKFWSERMKTCRPPPPLHCKPCDPHPHSCNKSWKQDQS
jgi:hypothetical protein